MSADARILVQVPIVPTGGSRVVAIDDAGTIHVLTWTHPEELAVAADQSFAMEGALALARRVLAGDQRAMTSPGTLRILAAAIAAADAASAQP